MNLRYIETIFVITILQVIETRSLISLNGLNIFGEHPLMVVIRLIRPAARLQPPIQSMILVVEEQLFQLLAYH